MKTEISTHLENLRPKLEPQIDVFCSAKSMVFASDSKRTLVLFHIIFNMYFSILLENLEMCGNTLDSKAYYFLTIMLNTRRSHQVGHHQLPKIALLRSLLQAVDPIGTAHGCGPTGGRDTWKSHQEMFSDFQKFHPEILNCSEKILKFFIQFALRIAMIHRITWILVQKNSHVVTVQLLVKLWNID